MDDDPVLRSLGADLQRNDPRLAALLTGDGPHRHRAAWLLLALPLLIPALLLPGRVMLGVLAVLLILSSPLMVAWLCAGSPGAPDARA